jgi:hypothetical protein
MLDLGRKSAECGVNLRTPNIIIAETLYLYAIGYRNSETKKKDVEPAYPYCK